jgi:ferredoxin-NADP reductase
MLGKNFINIITREKSNQYINQRVDEKLIKNLVDNFDQYFYICGPEKFVSDLQDILKKLGAAESKIVIEK